MSLLRDPVVARRMGESGRRKVLSLYTEQPSVARWNQLLTDLRSKQQRSVVA